MRSRLLLLVASAVMLLLLAAALIWFFAGTSSSAMVLRQLAHSTNPALDVRYAYDERLFRPAPYNTYAEFPLRLDAHGTDGKVIFSFYGKRIRGLAKMLAKDPAPLLFDFVGQQNDSVFEEYYKLKPLAPPHYADATIKHTLGLHQQLSYALPADKAWPLYFPKSLEGKDKVYVEGWTFFSKEDLFFFYAISPAPLTRYQRSSCLAVLNSLQFGALQGK